MKIKKSIVIHYITCLIVISLPIPSVADSQCDSAKCNEKCVESGKKAENVRKMHLTLANIVAAHRICEQASSSPSTYLNTSQYWAKIHFYLYFKHTFPAWR